MTDREQQLEAYRAGYEKGRHYPRGGPSLSEWALEKEFEIWLCEYESGSHDFTDWEFQREYTVSAEKSELEFTRECANCGYTESLLSTTPPDGWDNGES